MSATGNDSQEPLSKARLRLWLKMLKATNSVEHEIRSRMRRVCQSTLPRFDVMSALSRAPKGLKMSEISRLLRVSNGNVTGIVDTLTEDGLVVRVAMPGDRRAHLVRLTTKGTEVFAAQAVQHEAWVDELLGGFDQHAADGMTRRLTDLSRFLEKGEQNAQ